MRRTKFLAILFILPVLLLGVSGCSDSTARDNAEGEDGQVPLALKERVPGLDAGDYRLVKEKADAFTARLKAHPNETDALIGLAQIFMYEARVTGDHPYYYPAALELIDRALAGDPQNYEALVSKASVLLSLHSFSEALSVAEKSVAAMPDRAVGYGALVDANVELGRYAEAIEAADHMVALRPDLKSYSRISYLREIHGDNSGAIEAMKLAVDAGAPGSEEKAWARTTLGNLYLEGGNLEKAEREFRMASLERLDYPFALAGIARVYALGGQRDSAMEILDRALSLVPEFSFVETKADLYRAAGNHRVADSLVAVVEEMLAEDEASGHSMDRELALLYARHGIKTDEAVDRAHRELARRPDNVQAQDMMAYVLLRSGEPEEADQFMRRARRMGAENGMMTAHAGLIQVALGNDAKGRAMLKEAMQLNPHLPALLQNQVREALGKG